MNPLLRRRTWLVASSLLLPHVARAQERPPRVVATFSILADMVRAIVPTDFEVTALVGPDADAHVFEPRPADGRRIAQSDLVVVHGMGFEGWMDRLVRASGYRGAVLVASEGIRARADAHHGVDPHAWQDLRNVRRYADTLARGLAARWPARRAELLAGAERYRQRAEQLDVQVHAWLAPIPRAQRRVLTPHDAFGYFADAYGVDFLAPQGWTTSSEPSAGAVARLVRQLRQQRVRAVFLENITDRRLVERIAKEAGATVGGTLYSDALSMPGGPASTYLQLIEHNARTIAAALAA